MNVWTLFLFYGNFVSIFLPVSQNIRYCCLVFCAYIFYKNYFGFINHWLECFIYTKRFLIDTKEYFWKTPDFYLKKATFYSSMRDKTDITRCFRNNMVKRIDKSFFHHIFKTYEIESTERYYINIRIKLEFFYKGQESILFVPYRHRMYSKRAKENMLEDDFENIYVPYPPFSEEIIERYRKNIVYPYYSEPSLNKKIYSMFGIDCKNIECVRINGNKDFEKSEEMELYVRKCQTPFHDFGLLYHCPVKLDWMLEDLGMRDVLIENVEIKYMNYYFDEDKCELIEHKILLTHGGDILISDIKLDFLRALKKEENLELFFDYM